MDSVQRVGRVHRGNEAVPEESVTYGWRRIAEQLRSGQPEATRLDAGTGEEGMNDKVHLHKMQNKFIHQEETGRKKVRCAQIDFVTLAPQTW